MNINSALNYESVEIKSKVLRNTYNLLALTLLFSTVTCGIGMLMGLSHTTGIVLSLVGLGILFYMSFSNAINTEKALPLTFLFTGIEGLSLAPIVSFYIASSGSQIVLQSLGGTALIFFALSAYVLNTKKDFSFMRGFLFIALIGLLLVMLGVVISSLFFGVSLASSALSLGISYAVILVMSGYILLNTSDIIHGYETNYVRACIGLYINIINIFISLLNILSSRD